jgi:hypothetical protein
MPTYTDDLSDGNAETQQQDEPPLEIVIECWGCGLDITDSEYHRLSRGPVCNDCIGECGNCGNAFNRNSGSEHANVGLEIMCNRCTRNDYRWCDGCQEWTHLDDYRYIECESIYRCQYCTDNNYVYCQDCDQYHCDECYSQCESGIGRSVHDYSYRPTPLFHALDGEIENAPRVTHEINKVSRTYAKVPFMGLEVEVECRGGSSTYRQGAELLGEHPDFRDLVYLKTDGSLQYGFEIVTHPMTLGWAMQNFPWRGFAELSHLGFDAWDTNTCGLHIHVSRDGFQSESHQARFVHFIVRNAAFMEFLAGRSNSRWSSFDRSQLRDIKEKVRRACNSDRYLAVNLQNQSTLEVRIFRSSLNTARIKMCMQLVHAVIRYTDNLTARDFVQGKAFTDGAFVEWIKQNTDTYSILAEYLKEWYVPFLNGSHEIGE